MLLNGNRYNDYRWNSLFFNALNKQLIFRLDIKLTLFCALLLPLLLALGCWQLSRAEQKTQLLANYKERAVTAPQPLDVLLQQQDWNNYRVRLEGVYDPQKHFLLDNRVHDGRAGYEVISPFILSHTIYLTTEGGDKASVDYVWVNRGWIPMGPSRHELPEILELAGQRVIIGQIYVPQGKGLILKDTPLSGKWPEVIQQTDFNQMKDRYAPGDTALPFTIRLDAGSVGAFKTGWQPINMGPQKHLGYAFQWFLMAAVLSVLYLYASISRRGGQDEHS